MTHVKGSYRYYTTNVTNEYTNSSLTNIQLTYFYINTFEKLMPLSNILNE
jgi:hypothetical protein